MSDHLYIDQDWCVALGLTREEIAKMGLREFAERCYDRGIIPVVGEGGHGPGLTLKGRDRSAGPPPRKYDVR